MLESGAIRPDLHLHTCFSDGMDSPEQVFRLAREKRLSLIAITDHDTMEGLHDLQNAQLSDLILIPGIEMSANLGERDVHILGYGVRAGSGMLEKHLEIRRAERVERCRRILAALEGLGCPMEMDVEHIPCIGRMHIARAMVRAGYVPSIDMAFNRYLLPGCPAYVARRAYAPSEIIRLLREVGVVPVLAHPARISLDDMAFLSLLHEWMDAGLMGMEVYHCSGKPRYATYDRIARERKLLVTGGSDYHGDSTHGEMGRTLCDWALADEDASALLASIENLS